MPVLLANMYTDFTSWPWPVQLYPTVRIKANCISDMFDLFGLFLVGRHRHILFVMVSSLLHFISKPENFQRQIKFFSWVWSHCENWREGRKANGHLTGTVLGEITLRFILFRAHELGALPIPSKGGKVPLRLGAQLSSRALAWHSQA